jgi:hypothetical protein
VKIIKPVLFTWNGEAMVPSQQALGLCNGQFTVGGTYRLAPVSQRSMESHKHYFACIHEAWLNLPEMYQGRWRTDDELRYWALCQTEFCDTTTFKAASKAEALRFAAQLLTIPGFRVVELAKGNPRMVLHKTPWSQAVDAMPGQIFQASKQAVLDILSDMIGVTSKELEREGKAAVAPRRSSPPLSPDHSDNVSLGVRTRLGEIEEGARMTTIEWVKRTMAATACPGTRCAPGAWAALGDKIVKVSANHCEHVNEGCRNCYAEQMNRAWVASSSSPATARITGSRSTRRSSSSRCAGRSRHASSSSR